MKPDLDSLKLTQKRYYKVLQENIFVFIARFCKAWYYHFDLSTEIRCRTKHVFDATIFGKAKKKLKKTIQC
jgi:hypothetical protein